MGENFAFFLPVMMASFGVVFLAMTHWQVPSAKLWSAAFFCAAGGFATPLGFAALPGTIWGILAELLFLSGFLLFSQALMQRWRPGWLLRARISIWLSSLLISGAAIALDDLVVELVVSDLSCFLLIALPLIAGRKHLHLWRDRALFAATTFVALDNLIRGSTVSFTTSASGSFFDSEYAYLMQALACVFGLFLALAALAAMMLDLLERYQRDALVDPLSGLLNRRGFDHRVKELVRERTSGSVVVCDIDRFKNVNDKFGHNHGDRVIALLADILRTTAPPDTVAARFGGEEFVLFIPNMPPARAFAFANKVRETFTDAAYSELDIPCELSASFGIAHAGRGELTIDAVIGRADEALYQAKAEGRNRVCLYRPAPVTEDFIATYSKLAAYR